MTRDELKAAVDKYGLKLMHDDQIVATKTQGVNPAEFRAEIGPHKQEFIEFLVFEERARREEFERREATFEAIPGVAELRVAYEQRGEWHRAFDRMMETGSSIMPAIAAPTPEELKALEEQYPDAVWALEVERREQTTTNYELGAIWKETYDALCDGQDIATVRAQHEEKMKVYTDRHIWD